MLKKAISVILAVVTIICLFNSSPTFSERLFNVTASAVSIPKPTDKATEENVLALLSVYNKDAYKIMYSQKDDIISWLFWFYPDYKIISNIDTAVHETTHHYTGNTKNFKTEYIFADSETQYELTNYDDLFETNKAVAGLSKELKTLRYNTYVSSSSENSSNKDGIFGLMNEFTAYYHGLEVMTSLVPYFQKYKDSSDCWRAYSSSLGNNLNAYAEFKFWILEYMIYAKKNYPKVYKELLSDEEFCTAYTDIDKRFSELLNVSFSGLSKLPVTITYTSAVIKYQGNSVPISDYFNIMKQLEKQKYVTADKEIKDNARNGTTIKSLSSNNNVITVKWKKTTKNINGYQIRYSEYDTMAQSKTLNVKKNTSTSAKIKGLKASTTYYVQIRTYKTVNNKKYFSAWSGTKNIKTS